MKKHLHHTEGLTEVCQNRDTGSHNTCKCRHGCYFRKRLQRLDPPDICYREDQHAAGSDRNKELKASHVQSPGKQIVQRRHLQAVYDLIRPCCEADEAEYHPDSEGGKCLFI